MNKLYQILTLYKISADDLLYLHFFKEGVEILSKYLSFDIERLLKQNILKQDDEAVWVTRKGTLLLSQVAELFKDNGTLVTEENLDEFINQYRMLFPVGKRAHKAALKTKFLKFFKNHDYSLDLILKATKKYVKEITDRDAVQYMKQADYFIEKDGVSILLNTLAELEDSPEETVKDKTSILRSLYGAN
jgi:hypothetical protein